MRENVTALDGRVMKARGFTARRRRRWSSGWWERSSESAGDAVDGRGFRPMGGGFAPELGFEGLEAAPFRDRSDGGLEVGGILMEESIEDFMGFFQHYDAF
jgi:hypothetical protein